ncbi:MAG: hypothetical protein ACXVZU_05205, partial [Methanobacteriaceae archaeon]
LISFQKIERPILTLIKHSTYISPNNAQCNKLNASEKKYDYPPTTKIQPPRAQEVSPSVKAKRGENKVTGITNVAINHRFNLP